MSATGRSYMSREEGDHKINDMAAKFNFMKDGSIKLPPGFRFQPTDQEIVFQYLLRKTISCPLPATIIPEFINISLYNPRDLPGDWEQDRYFFSKTNYVNIGNRLSGGYWKTIGQDKRITPTTTIIRSCGSNSSVRRDIAIMGTKKTLVFCKAAGNRTHWFMHEYRLLHSLNPSGPQKSWAQMGDWVLCHIFLKKRSRNIAGDEDEEATNVGLAQQKRLCDFLRPDDYEVTSFTASSSSSSSSSSFLDSSSIITEVSSSSAINCYEDN